MVSFRDDDNLLVRMVEALESIACRTSLLENIVSDLSALSEATANLGVLIGDHLVVTNTALNAISATIQDLRDQLAAAGIDQATIDSVTAALEADIAPLQAANDALVAASQSEDNPVPPVE